MVTTAQQVQVSTTTMATATTVPISAARLVVVRGFPRGRGRGRRGGWRAGRPGGGGGRRRGGTCGGLLSQGGCRPPPRPSGSSRPDRAPARTSPDRADPPRPAAVRAPGVPRDGGPGPVAPPAANRSYARRRRGSSRMSRARCTSRARSVSPVGRSGCTRLIRCRCARIIAVLSAVRSRPSSSYGSVPSRCRIQDSILMATCGARRAGRAGGRRPSASPREWPCRAAPARRAGMRPTGIS